MKALFLATLTLLSLQLGAGAQTQTISTQPTEGETAASISSEANLTKSATTTDFDRTSAADSTPFIEDSLGLPIIRDQLTITESTQDLSINAEDIDSSYGKMMQDFAATLDGHDTAANSNDTTRDRNPLFDILIGFIVEIVITLIVLRIAFQVCGFRCRFSQLVPLSLAVAIVGAFLSVAFGVGLFNPARIGLSFIIMLVLIRSLTNVHEWSTAILITLSARLVSAGMMWLVVAGMMPLFGL